MSWLWGGPQRSGSSFITWSNADKKMWHGSGSVIAFLDSVSMGPSSLPAVQPSTCCGSSWSQIMCMQYVYFILIQEMSKHHDTRRQRLRWTGQVEGELKWRTSLGDRNDLARGKQEKPLDNIGTGAGSEILRVLCFDDVGGSTLLTSNWFTGHGFYEYVPNFATHVM
jgi:hypothetical protein